MHKTKLSKTPTGQRWLRQFSEADQPAAAAMLNAILLLNEEQVARAIRSSLHELSLERSGFRKRIALYAEREFPEAHAFQLQLLDNGRGGVRRRAVGRTGPAAVRPTRSSTRVGSEGLVAFVISQAVEAWPATYSNHPGPDRIRSARTPIGAIAAVTDFIGSGTRICTMLDKFWNVPSVRAWKSLGYIEFIVVAAAGTSEGIEIVRAHRARPRTIVSHITPTLFNVADGEMLGRWEALLQTYGPNALTQDRYGFGRTGALVAFNYRIPNNVPPILRIDHGGWRALYTGPAPEDLSLAFGSEEPIARVEKAAATVGVELSAHISVPDAEILVALKAIRGRWRPGAEVAIAERTGLTVPEILAIHRSAIRMQLLTTSGRLTDAGHAALQAGTKSEQRRRDVPTAIDSYYPKRLRVPRG